MRKGRRRRKARISPRLPRAPRREGIGHRDLLTAVWGAADAEDTQYLRVVVGQLRQKLEPDPAQPHLIQTEPAVGYRLSV